MTAQDRERRRAIERHLAGEHLVDHHPERVDVGPNVAVPFRALRGEVFGTADECAGGGQALLSLEPGDTEIQDADVAVVDADIVRLQVAVGDAALMCGIQRPRHLDGDLERLFDRQRAGALDQVGERLAGHVLHDQVGRAVVLGEVGHAGDAR